MKYQLLCIMILVLALAANASAASGNVAIISISLINQNPDPAVGSNIVEIRIGIENQGGKETANMVIEAAPEYPFSMVPGDSAVQEIGTLQAYQDTQNMKIVKYRLTVDKDAKAGSYDLPIKYYPKDSNAFAQTSVSISVSSKESAEVIHIDKTTLLPGKQESLKFKITNVGNAPLEDLRFSWENEDKVILPVASDNSRYLSYLGAGESAEIEYQVIADSNAVAGLYQLDLSLTYADSSGSSTNSISTIAGVYVGGKTDFDVAFSESSSGQISFTIANIGANPATSVSVIIPQQRNWRVTGTNSAIIGNLAKGDYTVASFKLQAASTSNRTMGAFPGQTTQAPGAGVPATGKNATSATSADSQLIQIQISYTDTMGERQTVEKELTLSPQNLNSGTISIAGFTGGRQQTTSFWSKYKWFIIAIVAIVLIGGSYFIIRKRKALKAITKAKK